MQYSLPVVEIPDEIITDNLVESVTGINTYGYGIVDKDVADRYTFLTAVKSPISLTTAVVFYDNLDKEIFVVPDLSYMDSTIYNGARFHVDGYGIGVNSDIPNYTYTEGIPYDYDNYPIELGTPNTATKLDIIKLRGFNTSAGSKKSASVQISTGSNPLTVWGSDNLPTYVLDLGVTANVVPNSKIPTHGIYQRTTSNYGIAYAGLARPTRLRVLINF